MRIAQDLALCLLKLGKTDDAKKMLEDTCRRLSDKLGSKHLLVSKCEENLKAVKEAEEARKGKEREKVSLGSPSLD
jgi:predicted Zn-dependent protease